ncbi:MAG: hypothetical protein HEP71_20615 [Roseivirga sp.]|nr:hypothetical protein [Roseivirga sp.]
MAENKFKIEDKSRPDGNGLFGWMSRWVKNDSTLEKSFPVRYLPKIVFAVVLGVVYVWNTHYAERTVRKIDKLETEVEDLRADVTTLEADYMYSSKQSEVAKKVKALGLEESKKPPYKIVAEEGEY